MWYWSCSLSCSETNFFERFIFTIRRKRSSTIVNKVRYRFARREFKAQFSPVTKIKSCPFCMKATVYYIWCIKRLNELSICPSRIYRYGIICERISLNNDTTKIQDVCGLLYYFYIGRVNRRAFNCIIRGLSLRNFTTFEFSCMNF